ncbi:MAG: CMP deaminase [Richelia sp. RM2_1_2]|nr:CMP deaminase [Richelia sp. RM2_1_2]
MKILNSNINWDQYYIKLAQVVALKSKDPSTKCGVVLVSQNNSVLGSGYNNFPRAVLDLEERYNDRKEKYNFICHAEVSCICNCAFNGVKTEGAKLYTNFGINVCHDCAKVLIQAGISEIIGEKINEDFASGRWCESFKYANLLLEEAKVLRREIVM